MIDFNIDDIEVEEKSKPFIHGGLYGNCKVEYSSDGKTWTNLGFGHTLTFDMLNGKTIT